MNNVPLDGPYPEDANAPDVAPRTDQMQPLPPIEYQASVPTQCPSPPTHPHNAPALPGCVVFGVRTTVCAPV